MEETSREQDFIQWISSRDGVKIHEQIELFHRFPNTGRGVRAKSYISKGDVLVEIPPTCLIAPPGLIDEENEIPQILPISKHLKSHDPPLSNWLSLVIKLMYMLTHSKEIPEFAPYLNILPSTFSTPLHFDPDEMKLLEGTSLHSLLTAENLAVVYAEKVVPIIESSKGLIDKSVCDYAVFARAASIVPSRGFHGINGDGPYLVPVADVFNHAIDNSTVLSIEDGTFKMMAERDIARGEEIYNTYGNLSNAQLLHTYGFILEDNMNDNVVIDAMLMERCADEEDIPNFHQRIEWLISRGTISEGFVISKEEMMPKELIDAAQVLLMEEAEFQEFKLNPFQLEIENEDDEYVMAVYQMILALVNVKLNAYATSLADDVRKKKTEDMSRNAEMALSIGITEKMILMELRGQLMEEIRDLQPKPQRKKGKKDRR
eukprot:TRINITY_DN5296_c0_g1_i1.p1 TRINITY_DN5296_c0_g1~~TRINITY_DN5296_c0_g1_i1.p1  ORF type:complete len:431 (-),score=143.67 TRINITY_DN5296_c0_g1_i1:9-1301(-)